MSTSSSQRANIISDHGARKQRRFCGSSRQRAVSARRSRKKPRSPSTSPVFVSATVVLTGRGVNLNQVTLATACMPLPGGSLPESNGAQRLLQKSSQVHGDDGRGELAEATATSATTSAMSSSRRRPGMHILCVFPRKRPDASARPVRGLSLPVPALQ